MNITLNWEDENYGVQGFDVYRDTLPFDPQNLPAPLVSLGPEARSYEDTDALQPGVAYRYYVTALVDGQSPGSAVGPFTEVTAFVTEDGADIFTTESGTQLETEAV